MLQVFTIFLVLAIFPTGFVLGDCCMSKTVGPHAYTLIENDAAAITMGCKSSCVYQRDEEAGTRFCFKTGDLPVTCEDSLSFDGAGNIKLQFQNKLASTQVKVTVTIQPGPQPPSATINANANGVVEIPNTSEVTAINVAFGGQTQCSLLNTSGARIFTIKPPTTTGLCKIIPN